MKKYILPLSAIVLLTVACAPKIYIIDRQTVLEEEAAGSWPQFEQELISAAPDPGPTEFGQVPVNARKARLYRVLNGELVSNSNLTADPHAGKSAK